MRPERQVERDAFEAIARAGPRRCATGWRSPASRARTRAQGPARDGRPRAALRRDPERRARQAARSASDERSRQPLRRACRSWPIAKAPSANGIRRSATASGSDTCGAWPVSSTSSSAPAIVAAARLPRRSGMTGSRLPQTTSVGAEIEAALGAQVVLGRGEARPQLGDRAQTGIGARGGDAHVAHAPVGGACGHACSERRRRDRSGAGSQGLRHQRAEGAHVQRPAAEAAGVDEHEALDQLGAADRQPPRGEAADGVAEHHGALRRQRLHHPLGHVRERHRARRRATAAARRRARASRRAIVRKRSGSSARSSSKSWRS